MNKLKEKNNGYDTISEENDSEEEKVEVIV